MNKLLQIVLLFCAIFNFNIIKAQDAKLDSLENCLKTHLTDDTVKVKLLNEIVRNIYKNDADKAYDIANKAVEISEKLNFSKGKAESFFLIGTSISYHKSDTLALEYFLKALRIAEDINNRNAIAQYLIACGVSYASIGNISEATRCYLRARKIGEELKDQSLITKSLAYLSVIYTGKGDYRKALDGYQEILGLLEKKDDKKMRSRILINMGEINKYQGNYPQAIESYHKALKLKEEDNIESGISLCFINIGSVCILQGDYEKALDYEHRALKIADKLNDKRLISNCYEEIGNVYLQTNKPEALEYYQKALTIVEKLSYQTPILRILSKMGDFYRAQGDYNEALVNYSRALKISEELSRKRTICETSIKIGGIYFLQKEYAKALEYNQKCLLLANELKLLDNQKDIYKQLSEIYGATGEYKKAYIHHKLYTQISDSVYNEKNVKKIAELEYTYKFEKEKQAIELKQQKKDAVHNAILFSLIVGFVLVSFFAVYVFRSSRIKHKVNLILTKQKYEIEELNEEYRTINEELITSNDALVITKELVEERENLLIQITDNIPVFISLVDNDLNYLFANNGYAEVFNREKKDIYGRKIKDVLDHESYQRAYPNIIKTLKGETVTYENSLHQNDGSRRILKTTYLPYYQKKLIQGLIVCSDDITERKKAEQTLKESEAEKARLMQMEIGRIGRELESNQKSVTAATLKLIQNSERDAQTIERLMEIEESIDPTGKQKINTLISDYKRLSFNSNWNEFEILFEKVHSSFYEELNTQFPTLTANERKICAFLKLNMSNKDIAQITFQSDDALKKARLRLRQKLEIDRETNLVAFLQNI